MYKYLNGTYSGIGTNSCFKCTPRKISDISRTSCVNG